MLLIIAFSSNACAPSAAEVFIGMGSSKFTDGKLTDESTRKCLTDLLTAFKPWIERMRAKK